MCAVVLLSGHGKISAQLHKGTVGVLACRKTCYDVVSIPRVG